MKATAVKSKQRRGAPAAKPRSKAALEPVRDAERTRQAILAAAEVEFADKGLAGARVDAIAEQSGANKQMLYYYFGSKENLYVAVLERAYGAMRQTERELDLLALDPLDAIRKLVEFKFDYLHEHPSLIRLLAVENVHNARYLKRSRHLRDMHNSLVTVLQAVLAAGQARGQVKPGIDPLQLYISLAGLSYFFFANAATLSTAFGRDLVSDSELKRRRAHVVEMVLDHIRVR
ncbi:MAG: TetR/AcrR family transcriptional regulator [Rhodoplanes sp.]|uniref:TetR/AcrR family transcriptional regulator n=1 Tax=Rhodoplanes sp. TaxID=1968906 RepID=UPI0017E14337|nr:TetR/AcrR family transcriptional regulator [Rhodoplanes sp.]NVO15229.1 TetR/AcrR family transcriptional regulator [Rhodoplanes sp.]